MTLEELELGELTALLPSEREYILLRKTGFPVNRRHGMIHVCGTDLRNYRAYLNVALESERPVWLLVLSGGGGCKDSPLRSPGGLYGQDLTVLAECELEICANHPPHPDMVYWRLSDFVPIDERAKRDFPYPPQLTFEM